MNRKSLIVVGLVGLSLKVLFSASTSVDVVLLLTSILSLIVVSLPILLSRTYSPVEPVTFIALSVLIGCTLKAFYLVGGVGQNALIDDKLLLGLDLGSMVIGSGALLLGLSSVIAGYMVVPTGHAGARRRSPYVWSYNRVLIVSVLLTVSSMLALVVFALRMNISIDGLDSLSAKRFRDDDGAVTASRNGNLEYLLYRIALLAKFPFYLLVYIQITRGFRWVSIPGLLLIASGFMSVFVPFFVNNRAGILLPMIDAAIIAYMVTQRVNWKAVLVVGSGLSVLFLAGTVFRAGGSVNGIYDIVFGGRYLIDVTKTAHIVGYYQDTGAYHYGSTLLNWMYKLIPGLTPTSVDESNLGFYLGFNVFGYIASGVPPGIVAETFLNFGWPGVVVGMFVLGMALKLFYVHLGLRARSPGAVLIYALLSTRFTVFVFNNDLSTAVLKSILDLVVLIALLRVINVRRRA